jgi:hypothetical protein
MGVDDMEKLGVPQTREKPNPVHMVHQQAIRERTELENRQKLWRSLVASALILLLAESCLAGWTFRRQTSILEGVRL